MSYLKLRRSMDIGVEVQAECQVCGSGLLSEATEGAWRDQPLLGSGARVVVKVSPCARCAREAAEVNGASIHREGK